jgi:hypothetical protein
MNKKRSMGEYRVGIGGKRSLGGVIGRARPDIRRGRRMLAFSFAI